ncbi:MAG: hypothetical protein COC17_07220 [Hyphomicrobiales bacterium]|nr:MAG: hypothetical protein COC17_07220 [Hyphomicrobiales bacterium]
MSRVGNFAFLLIVVFGLSGCNTLIEDPIFKTEKITKTQLIQKIKILRREPLNAALKAKLVEAEKNLNLFDANVAEAIQTGSVVYKYTLEIAELKKKLDAIPTVSPQKFDRYLELKEILRSEDVHPYYKPIYEKEFSELKAELKIVNDAKAPYVAKINEIEIKSFQPQKLLAQQNFASAIYFKKAVELVKYVQDTVDGWPRPDDSKDDSSSDSKSSNSDDADDTGDGSGGSDDDDEEEEEEDLKA